MSRGGASAPRVGGAHLRAAAQGLAVPLGAYLLITLVLPALRGAAARAEFWRHAAWVVGACLLLVALCAAAAAADAWLRARLGARAVGPSSREPFDRSAVP